MMDRSRARRRRYHRRTKVIVLRKACILSILAAAVMIYGAVELARWKGREVQGTRVSLDAADLDSAAGTGAPAPLPGSISVGGVNVTGLTREQAGQKLEAAYHWDIKVSDGEDSIPLEDPISPQLENLLEKIGGSTSGESRNYDLDYDQLEQAIEEQAAVLAQKWDRGAVNSQMESFDKESGTYQYTKETYGRNLRQEELVERLMESVRRGEFGGEIQAGFDTIAPARTGAQAREQYEVTGTFTTTVTDNKNRNQNIRLASEAIDGVVLLPGEEFSFNLTTGNRTSDKGYQPAGAYRNGVLIEEPGGGVCQVSTTLYHAIVNSGYKTTERNFHSFAPSYIEKGQDAMVSFDGHAGPDLKFVNTQETSVGLRASFDGRQLKLSIVGLPLLEENERISMRSEKVKDLEPPAPVYEENPALDYAEEKVAEQARPGSVWKTYRVLTRDGQAVEETYLHTSTYKAKPAKIQKNSSALPPSEERTPEDVVQEQTGGQVQEQPGGQVQNQTGGQVQNQTGGQENIVQEQMVIVPFSAQQ